MKVKTQCLDLTTKKWKEEQCLFLLPKKKKTVEAVVAEEVVIQITAVVDLQTAVVAVVEDGNLELTTFDKGSVMSPFFMP